MAGLVARRARRRGLGDGLPQRGLLRAARGRARRRATCGSPTAIVTTRWHRLGRRLRLTRRARRSTARTASTASCARRGSTLTREQLLRGAAHLARPRLRGGLGRPGAARLGDRVRAPRTSAPPTSRSSGCATPRSARSRRPPRRTGSATGRPTRPVPLPSVDGDARRCSPTRRAGRTSAAPARALHRRCGSGGLAGQTFEIEVVAHPAPRTPVFTRGYVTATALHEDRAAIDAVLDRAAAGLGEPALPPGARAAAAARADHARGPLPRPGRLARSSSGRTTRGAFIRDVGEWDPLPAAPRGPVPARRARGQVAFWGGGRAAGDRELRSRSDSAEARRCGGVPVAVGAIAARDRDGRVAAARPASDVARTTSPRSPARPCHARGDRAGRAAGHCITTTALSTSAPPSSCDGESDSPNAAAASADGHHRLERRQDRRRRRPDPREPGEEQQDRADRADQHDARDRQPSRRRRERQVRAAARDRRPARTSASPRCTPARRARAAAPRRRRGRRRGCRRCTRAPRRSPSPRRARRARRTPRPPSTSVMPAERDDQRRDAPRASPARARAPRRPTQHERRVDVEDQREQRRVHPLQRAEEQPGLGRVADRAHRRARRAARAARARAARRGAPRHRQQHRRGEREAHEQQVADPDVGVVGELAEDRHRAEARRRRAGRAAVPRRRCCAAQTVHVQRSFLHRTV